MTKYPKIPEERNCIIEKRLRDAARQSYYQKLLSRYQQAVDAEDGMEGAN
jgi:hypothetical protein